MALTMITHLLNIPAPWMKWYTTKHENFLYSTTRSVEKHPIPHLNTFLFIFSNYSLVYLNYSKCAIDLQLNIYFKCKFGIDESLLFFFSLVSWGNRQVWLHSQLCSTGPSLWHPKGALKCIFYCLKAFYCSRGLNKPVLCTPQGLLMKIDAFHYIQLGTVYR